MLSVLRICSHDDVRRLGRLFYTYRDKAVVLFYYDDKTCAFDDQCSYMGYPLSRNIFILFFR